jgi:hypothetical protein
MVRHRHIPFAYGAVNRDINYQLQLYAVYTVGTGSTYSLSGVSQVNLYDILGNAFASQEFIDLQDQYAIYKISNVFFTYTSTISPGMTSIQSLTPAFLAPNYGYNSSVNASNIARSDAALELKMNNVGQGAQTLSLALPPCVFGANGYAIAGLNSWFSTVMPIAAGNLSIMLGYLNTPTFASTASTQYIPVGVLDFHIKFTFAQPVLE